MHNCTLGLAKIFSVKMLKFLRELWIKTKMHTNFERSGGIFYHVVMALQSEHFWSFNILTKNIFARPILYVYYAQKISKLPKHFWMYSGALRIGTIFFFSNWYGPV